MGIRETLNQKPALALGVGGVLIVIAVTFAAWYLYAGDAGIEGGQPVQKAWYTTDDGATYFADDINKVYPFQKDGKTANRCYVFQCDGKKFVAYLERFDGEAKKKLDELAAKGSTSANAGARELIEITGKQVKLPKTGDTGWVRRNEPGANRITTVKCPSGKGEPEAVAAE